MPPDAGAVSPSLPRVRHACGVPGAGWREARSNPRGSGRTGAVMDRSVSAAVASSKHSPVSGAPWIATNPTAPTRTTRHPSRAGARRPRAAIHDTDRTAGNLTKMPWGDRVPEHGDRQQPRSNGATLVASSSLPRLGARRPTRVKKSSFKLSTRSGVSPKAVRSRTLSRSRWSRRLPPHRHSHARKTPNTPRVKHAKEEPHPDDPTSRGPLRAACTRIAGLTMWAPHPRPKRARSRGREPPTVACGGRRRGHSRGSRPWRSTCSRWCVRSNRRGKCAPGRVRRTLLLRSLAWASTPAGTVRRAPRQITGQKPQCKGPKRRRVRASSVGDEWT